MFDRVLLDPPCTALGQRPRLSEHQLVFDRRFLTKKQLFLEPIDIQVNELQTSAKYQQKLIQIAIELLKPKGTLSKRFN